MEAVDVTGCSDTLRLVVEAGALVWALLVEAGARFWALGFAAASHTEVNAAAAASHTEVLDMLRGPLVAVGTAAGVWGSVVLCSGSVGVPARWGTGRGERVRQYWSPVTVAPLDAHAAPGYNI